MKKSAHRITLVSSSVQVRTNVVASKFRRSSYDSVANAKRAIARLKKTQGIFYASIIASSKTKYSIEYLVF